MEFFILFLLSVPVFYIYGLFVFFRNIFGNKSKTKIDSSPSLQDAIIRELTIKASESPNKTIKELLSEYIKRTDANPLVGFTESHTELLNLKRQQAETNPEFTELKNAKPLEDFFATWYSNNSINLLLYIGAFLIISAAGIFVSFQWETMPGTIKALLLTLVGAGFFGFGWYFYSIPKIRNAGVTFIAIAAILIPVIGSAWYTFVMRDAGIPAGIAWMFTSAVALTAYVSLALYMRMSFYAYASTITTFSFMLSIVNTFDLNKNFYLLASIITCFILLILSYAMKKVSDKTSELFSLPTDLTAQIAMPITLVYGFITAISDEQLFTLEGTLSALLAALFYFTSYYLTSEVWKLAFSEVLLLLAVFFGCQWLAIPHLTIYYLLGLLSLGYCVIGYYYLTESHKEEEADATFIIATFASILVFLVGFASNILPIHQAALALIPITTSGLSAYLKKNPYPLLITSSFFAVFLYIVYARILGYDEYPQYLGLLYLIQAVARYMLTFSLGKKKETLQVGHITIVSYSILSLILTVDHQWILLICTSVISFMLFSTSLLQKVRSVSYLGVFFAIVSALLFFDLINTPSEIYPFILLLLSCLVFFVGRLAPEHLMHELRVASLVLSAGSNVFYFFMGDMWRTPQQDNVQRNALLSSYGTTILFAIDYLTYQTKSFGYATSIVGMGTLLWQIYYLGFTDALMYTTPLGLYFLAIAYTRRVVEDIDHEKLFNSLGLFFLLAPPFFLSLGNNETKYSMILFAESCILVFAGISFSQQLFRFAGFAGIVLAILPQTYSYILSLPRWVVVGILGMAFLSFAIFLLLKRKEEEH